MLRSKAHSESGARPSNAGDRYHLVYVARRLLDLLHPYSGLTQLVIENVSLVDGAAERDPKAFLGVDVSEYYGGEDVATSQAVDLVQVKYSPLRPDLSWTLSRLTKKKDGGDSVFRKLAAMFNALAASTASPSPRARVTIRLLTNQPLGAQLRQDLESLRIAIEGKAPRAAGRALEAIGGRAGDVAKAFREASRLSWARLSELLASWDLEGFDHPWLARTEGELFQALSGFSRDGSEQLRVLLDHLQVRATPGQRETLRRTDVLAFLHLTEDAFYPAPTELQDDVSLFETRSSVRVRQALEQGDSHVVVHGRSGSGKTSALRLVLRDHGGGGKAILYDCYADGRGLRPGAERFPYRKCFTQVINELDARYRTGILATVDLEYHSLMRQLDRALEAAARNAEQQGHRLILAFDAIDNANDQKRRAPVDAGESFIPILWRLELPKNCTLAVSLRTENVPEVISHNLPDARSVEVTGFDEEETRRHAARLAPALPSEEVSFLHDRTDGNPRVQSKVLADIASHPPEDARRLIAETARRTAFDYYDQESDRRLASAEMRRLLAVLYEMRQAPRLADVTAILEMPEQDLRQSIGKLSFGLRLEGQRMAWQDQDFLDWAGERLGPERELAKGTLAEYCLQRFEQDDYARWNLSYHLQQARQFEQMVAWWREPGRLEGQIQAAHPHEERVLEDLRAALLGALHLGQMREAFDLLLRAAEIAEGRDAFADALADHPDVAVAADLAHLIPGGPGERDGLGARRVRDDHERASLTIAAELARWPERRGTARELFGRFKAAKNSERARNPEHGVRLSLHELKIYARYQARIEGFSAALAFIEEREPDFWTRVFARTVGSDWPATGETDPLGAISRSSLGSAECAAAMLGVLTAVRSEDLRGAMLRRLESGAIEGSVRILVQALTPGSVDPAAVLQEDDQEEVSPNPTGRAVLPLCSSIEHLAAAGFLDAACALLKIWLPPKPRHKFRKELEPYLRWAALREALTGLRFDPASYELPSESSRPGDRGTSEESWRQDEVRSEMKRSYSPLLVLARAWVGHPEGALAEEIQRLIGEWGGERFHVDQHSEWGYEEKAAILIEAILALPGNRLALIRKVVEAAEQALGGARGLARVTCADVLSRDERYVGEAERLIRKELEQCRPPQMPARQAMERLFSLYQPAARIHDSLARRLMVAAREVASEIDSRIYARAEALTAIAEAAQKDLEPERLDDLCAVTQYWWGIDLQSAQRAGERALVLLAAKDPGASVTRAWELDQKGLLALEDGLGHVVTGALARGTLPTGDVWPILPLLTHPDFLDTVGRYSIERSQEHHLPLAAALSAYCRYARLEAVAREPVERAQRLVAWAEMAGLAGHAEIVAMRAYAERLGTALSEQRSGRRPPEVEDSWRHRAEPSPLYLAISGQLPLSPKSVLQRLEQAAGEELKALSFLELSSLLPDLLEALPLSERPRLAAVIERWGAGAEGVEALTLLDALLGNGGAEEPNLVQMVAVSIRRLLTPEILTSLGFPHRSEERNILLKGRWASPAKKLEAILAATAEHLRELGSDSLFFLASHASSLLERRDLADIARDFVARTVAEAPPLGAAAVPGNEPSRVIPYALFLALGHVRQALRWRAVYAVVHALVETEDPEQFLERLLDSLDNTALPRWLSVREWLAFALEHVSLRKPGVLRSAVPRLIPHAVSRDLPHAKIRHHLKQALLAIEESFPGSLGAEDRAFLERVNCPIAVVSRGELVSPRLGWAGEILELESSHSNQILPLDFMDTVRYWYQPLVRCFPGDEADIQRMILWKAEDWMARLGITRSAVEAERQQVGERYDWRQVNNDHGSQPQVELLRLYGERHALYLVAGEFVDSMPVVETGWRDGAGNEWDDWARDDLRGADPALPVRLLDVPPPLADNYGVFSAPVEIWRNKEEPDAFSRELEVLGEPDWIVVSGSRQAFEYDRSFWVKVESALVNPPSSRSLGKLLGNVGAQAQLPFYEVYYSRILPKVESALEGSEARWEQNAVNGLFVIKAWTVHFYQEMPLNDLDPFWPEHSRNYELPALDVLRRLGWTRSPTELLWHDAAGEPVARCNLWRRSNSAGSNGSSGYRLVMRRDAVSAYAREVGLDVIFSVRLQRQARSRSGSNERDEYDPGTTRCFFWSDLSKANASRKEGAYGESPQA